MQSKKSETATLAGGCFWCTEAIFQRLKGVQTVTSGYSGGQMPNPSYQIVTTGQTGHAEAIQIEFDPKMISFEKILDVFWATHDPTTLDQQGADVGSQYRSVIFYHSNLQKKTAEGIKGRLGKSGIYKNKIVTEIVPFISFYKAEEYHQNYYDSNRSAPYCSLVIDPKIQKFSKLFPNKIKS